MKKIETKKTGYDSTPNTLLSSYLESIVSEYSPGYGKDYSFSEFLQNKMLVIGAIQRGIPYSMFEFIRGQSSFSENEWAEYLDLSTKSLQRYKSQKEHVFRPIHSEKILELAEVIDRGLEVFGSHEKFELWLRTPSYALGGMKPLEMLRNSYGKEMVLAELIRIDQGIFS